CGSMSLTCPGRPSLSKRTDSWPSSSGWPRQRGRRQSPQKSNHRPKLAIWPPSYTDPVARILITGMSGAGKSTLLRALAGRGHMTVDTDYDGWTLDDSRWDAARMSGLLAKESDVVVAGTVDNQGDFYECFDHVVLLS